MGDEEPVDYNEENASQIMDGLGDSSGGKASNGKAAPPRRGPNFSSNAKPKNIFDDV